MSGDRLLPIIERMLELDGPGGMKTTLDLYALGKKKDMTRERIKTMQKFKIKKVFFFDNKTRILNKEKLFSIK